MKNVIMKVLMELLAFGFCFWGIYYVSGIFIWNPYPLWIGFIPLFILVVMLLEKRGQSKAELPIEEIVSVGHKQLATTLVLTILPAIFLGFIYISVLGRNDGQWGLLGVVVMFLFIGPFVILFAVLGLLRSILLYVKTKYIGFFLYIVLFASVAGTLLWTFKPFLIKNKPMVPELELENGLQVINEEVQKTSKAMGYISSDQAGIFKIGATIPNQETLSKNGYSITETPASSEGYQYVLYIVSKDGKPVLTFDLSTTDTISDIRVKSSEFRTSEGVAVGSTLSDFIKAYPNYRLWYTAEEGEKFILNTTKEASSPQFFLDRSDLINPNGVFYKTGIKASDFKVDAKITEIRLFYYIYQES